MGTQPPAGNGGNAPRQTWTRLWPLKLAILVGLLAFSQLPQKRLNPLLRRAFPIQARSSPYGSFPKAGDAFSFLPCTNLTLPPALDDPKPEASWAKLFDTAPENWSWGQPAEGVGDDSFDGRGIYLCGYLDAPLDYTNKSDHRIVRLAVVKYQVSGLARADGSSGPSAGSKSERTIVMNPGGPGGSGTAFAWMEAEYFSARLSDSTLDVLGWDPRGVNASLPAISCFPFDADRDHWSLLTEQYREVANSPRRQLEVDDAMNEAVFGACKEIWDDVPRFFSTAFVARDVEEIRKAMEEEDLTTYFVSYGTDVASTYANIFPNHVGRMILDGTEYQPFQRTLAGFGLTSLDNITDSWHDGVLGECLNAGPEHCALAKPVHGDGPVTLEDLEQRMANLFKSLAVRPRSGYTDFSGPSLVTYSSLLSLIVEALYNAETWPAVARMLFDLEAGNSTLAAKMLELSAWEYDPSVPGGPGRRPSSDELFSLVVCSDSYDAPRPENGLDWWDALWANMTQTSWLGGDASIFDVLPCQQFTNYWTDVAEVYRGPMNNTLKHPILIISETYDPATPISNGRALLEDMGPNARMIEHHGYGHTSRDRSNCTDAVAKRFILEGVLPDEPVTKCFANEKPYLYGVSAASASASSVEHAMKPSHMETWAKHTAQMAVMKPRRLRRNRATSLRH